MISIYSSNHLIILPWDEEIRFRDIIWLSVLNKNLDKSNKNKNSTNLKNMFSVPTLTFLD